MNRSKDDAAEEIQAVGAGLGPVADELELYSPALVPFAVRLRAVVLELGQIAAEIQAVEP